MLLQVLLDVATHVLWKDGSATRWHCIRVLVTETKTLPLFARHTPPSDVRMQICCRSKSLAAFPRDTVPLADKRSVTEMNSYMSDGTIEAVKPVVFASVEEAPNVVRRTRST